jgi:hypothetical protein
MLPQSRIKFATQVNADILATIRTMAQSEGRQLRALADEALFDLSEKRKQNKPRAHVTAAYQASHAIFGTLYKELAE